MTRTGDLRGALAAAQRAYASAAVRSEDLRRQRNDLVRQALAAGMTHAAIAELTGLTRGRINQLRQTSQNGG